MARGGKRQGRMGRAYSNRTDLALDRAPDQPSLATQGTGGMVAPAPRQAQAPQQEFMPSPDQVTNLDAPGDPSKGILDGIGQSFSDDTPDLIDSTLLAAYQRNPTAELLRVMNNLAARRFYGTN